MEEKNRHKLEKQMEDAKEILDGNAFYELDMECIRRKEKEKKGKEEPQKRQRR